MDYRHFDSGRPNLPPFIRRNLRYFRPAGIVLFIIGVIIPFLDLIDLIPSTYFLNFLSFTLLLLGPILYLLGLAWDTIADRSK